MDVKLMMTMIISELLFFRLHGANNNFHFQTSSNVDFFINLITQQSPIQIIYDRLKYSQVIVALSEKGRPHIPYRNCLMTSVLRDSLGGNCMTTMIATCSVEKANIDVCSFKHFTSLSTN